MACIVLHNMTIKDERGEQHEDFLAEAGPLLIVQRRACHEQITWQQPRTWKTVNWIDLQKNLV